MNKVYPIVTVECADPVGGSAKAKTIVEKMIREVGGLNEQEYKAVTVITTVNHQVCVHVKDQVTAKRIMKWKHLMNNIMWGHKRNRQVMGYMFHTIHRPRMIASE